MQASKKGVFGRMRVGVRGVLAFIPYHAHPNMAIGFVCRAWGTSYKVQWWFISKDLSFLDLSSRRNPDRGLGRGTGLGEGSRQAGRALGASSKARRQTSSTVPMYHWELT